MSRALDRLTVQGYLSIRDASVVLGDITVLVGANGAGKSNFISAFELLGRLVEGDLAFTVGRMGGAASLLCADIQPAREIVFDIKSSSRGHGRHDGDLTNGYRAVLVPAANDELIFKSEIVRFHETPAYTAPYAKPLGSGHRESKLSESGDVEGVSRFVRSLLSGCRVFHFHDTSIDAPVKQTTNVSDNLSLHADARNLASFLLRLQIENRTSYQQIVRAIQLVAPFFRDFVLAPDPSENLRLRWSQQGTDTIFPAQAMSDGTLRYVCLATLLLQPDPPALVVLDEPELGLHPFAVVQLAELLRSAATHSQVVIATQSVTLVNQFELTEIVVTERSSEGTSLTRPDNDRLRDWLEDYSLGELWEKNLLGGRPGPDMTPPRG